MAAGLCFPCKVKENYLPWRNLWILLNVKGNQFWETQKLSYKTFWAMQLYILHNYAVNGACHSQAVGIMCRFHCDLAFFSFLGNAHLCGVCVSVFCLLNMVIALKKLCMICLTPLGGGVKAHWQVCLLTVATDADRPPSWAEQSAWVRHAGEAEMRKHCCNSCCSMSQQSYSLRICRP